MEPKLATAFIAALPRERYAALLEYEKVLHSLFGGACTRMLHGQGFAADGARVQHASEVLGSSDRELVFRAVREYGWALVTHGSDALRADREVRGGESRWQRLPRELAL